MLVIKCVMSGLVILLFSHAVCPQLKVMLDYSHNTWVPYSNYGNDGDVVTTGITTICLIHEKPGSVCFGNAGGFFFPCTTILGFNSTKRPEHNETFLVTHFNLPDFLSVLSICCVM